MSPPKYWACNELSAVICLMLCVFQQLQPVRGQGQSAPTLFSDVAESVSVASASAWKLPRGLQIVQRSTSSGDQPALKLVSVNTQLLRGTTRRLQLDLPRDISVTATRRTDLTRGAAAALGIPTAASRSVSAQTFNATAAAGASIPASPVMFLGEVVGAKGFMSSVTLVVSESGAVYGNIRFWDKKQKQFRTFMVTPSMTEGEADLLAAQGMSASPGTIPASQLYPKVDTSKHLLLEYVEPDYIALLSKEEAARGHHDHLQEQAAAAAATTAPATVNTTPLGGKPVVTDVFWPLPGNDTTDGATTIKSADEVAAALAAFDASMEMRRASGNFITTTTSTAAATATAAAVSEEPSEIMSVPVNGRRLLQTAPTRTDLLVVYTAAAAGRLGGVASIENRIRMAVAEASKYYADSRVPLVLNLVGIRQISYTERTANGEGTLGTALSDAQANRIPNLHQWRNELGADMVHLWTNAPECGIGFVGPTDAFAYSANGGPCLTAFVLAHELGHNQGCSHNNPANPNDSPISPAYAHGWRRCDMGTRGFRTIMSYDCPGQPGNTNPTIPAFATPSLSFNGAPIGDASRGHCARRLTETRQQMAANRRELTSPPPTPSGSSIIARMNGRCVDAPSFDLGRQVILWGCHGGNNQRWELLADGSVRVPGTNRCLDVRSSGTADGTVVQVWECNGTPAQQWFYDSQGPLHPYAAPDKCLDAPNNNNGVGLAIFGCHSGANQAFNTNIFGGAFNPQNQNLRSRLNNMCLDVFAYDYRNTAPVVMWPCNTQPNQDWRTEASGVLRSTANTAKCLDANNANIGAPVYIFDCHSGLNQRWFRDPLGRLRPYHAPNRCLDVVGANPAQGVRVQLWECLDVNQQKWDVVNV